MKKIGIDLDNTVSDYLRGATPHIQEVYGLVPDLSREAYRLEEVFGITKEQRNSLNILQELYVERNLFRHLPQLEDDNHLLTHRLKEEIPTLKIYFVTARDAHPVIIEDTRYWLETNGFIFDDVFHVDDKADFCKMAGIPVMIEDEIRQIEGLVNRGVATVVMDQPWNRNLPQTINDQKNFGLLRRVHNWREAFVAAKELLT